MGNLCCKCCLNSGESGCWLAVSVSLGKQHRFFIPTFLRQMHGPVERKKGFMIQVWNSRYYLGFHESIILFFHWLPFLLPSQVDPQDLSDPSSVDKQYIYLIAKSDDGHFQFHKEAKILLSYKDGVVFIQTDKPVYTPRQSGKMLRLIPSFRHKPKKKFMKVDDYPPQYNELNLTQISFY